MTSPRKPKTLLTRNMKMAAVSSLTRDEGRGATRKPHVNASQMTGPHRAPKNLRWPQADQATKTIPHPAEAGERGHLAERAPEPSVCYSRVSTRKAVHDPWGRAEHEDSREHLRREYR